MRSLTVVVAIAAVLAAGRASGEVVKTYRSVDLYGYAVGLDLKPGDTVSAYSASGLLCGECTVREPGAYGFLHVYGDDPQTADVEGALEGEEISLRLNGAQVNAAGPDQPVWTQDGDRLQVNIAPAAAASEPVVPETGASSSSSDGCFIATAAFGSPLQSQVQALKRFRDQSLMASRLGLLLVRFYYRHSPPMAEFIASRETLRSLVRASLYPLAAAASVATDAASWAGSSEGPGAPADSTRRALRGCNLALP
jgi:hypothetical protein